MANFHVMSDVVDAVRSEVAQVTGILCDVEMFDLDVVGEFVVALESPHSQSLWSNLCVLISPWRIFHKSGKRRDPLAHLPCTANDEPCSASRCHALSWLCSRSYRIGSSWFSRELAWCELSPCPLAWSILGRWDMLACWTIQNEQSKPWKSSLYLDWSMETSVARWLLFSVLWCLARLEDFRVLAWENFVSKGKSKNWSWCRSASSLSNE